MIEIFRYLVGIIEEEEQKRWKHLVIYDLICPIMELFNFSVLFNIMNSAIQNGGVSGAGIAFIIFMVIMLIIKGIFDLNKCKIQSHFVYDGAQKLSVKLYESMIKESLMSHNQKSPIQALTMINSDAQSCMNIIATSIDVWVSILMMGGYYAVLVYVSRWIGVVSCLVFTFFVIGIFYYHRNQVRTYGERCRIQAIKASAQITIAYGCFKEMKNADRSANMLHKYQDISKEYAQTQREYQYNRNMISMMAQNVAMMAVFLVFLCFLLNPWKNMGVMFTSMAMYFAVLFRMIPMANCIVNGLNNVEFSKKSYEVVREGMLEYTNIKKKEEISKKTRRKKITFQKGLSVRNLTFAYNDQIKIFQNASLDIPAGHSVAIMGASGSGKTTFLDLILGLLIPHAGNIVYDDYDLVTHTDGEGECIADISDITSYIPQTIYLNGETIRNNVAFFVDEDNIDELKLVECLKCAQVWDDVMQMPEGINTLIGENGISVSGGQRQRIALARALYKEFDFLIMDEATAALDMETEKAVLDSIRHVKSNKTILIATHHMSLANECDMIYRIENKNFVRIK